MNTYLIFFGKSQDFTLHAFDSSQYVNDFNSVIKDFDELESKTFTVDDVSNNEILSKYNFKKNGKNYSLLKLYSLGQAANGSRISGSIYGVALLSENEIELSETNNAILNTVKKNFANLCLDGVKFKTSDFYQEAETIWKAIINHKEGNYFNKISYRNGNFNTNNKVKSFYINDIIKNSFEVNNEINNASRLYFSNDLEHLKRAQGKWGKEIFPIYAKENNQFVLYAEKPKPQLKQDYGSQDPELNDLRLRNAELRNELSGVESKYRKFKETAIQKFKIVSVLAIVFCLSTITFFFKDAFFGDDKTPPGGKYGPGGVQTEEGYKKNQVSLNDILVDDTKRNTLYNLLQNIENYEKPIDDREKYAKAIVRDAKIIGLKSAFYDKYVTNDNPPASGTPQPASGTKPSPPVSGTKPPPASGTKPSPSVSGTKPPPPASGTKPPPPASGTKPPPPASGTTPPPPASGTPPPPPPPAAGSGTPAGGGTSAKNK